MLPTDATVSDTLTRFLKHFKSCLHSHLTLIESCLGSSTESQKLKKANQLFDNEFKVEEEIWQIRINRQNWKTVERFCLRINEYLDYRLGKVKIDDKVISDQLESLKLSFTRIFYSFNKQVDHLNLASIITQVSQFQTRNHIKIIQYILSIISNLGLSSAVEQLLKKIVEDQRSKQFQTHIGGKSDKNGYRTPEQDGLRIQRIGSEVARDISFVKPLLRPRRVTLASGTTENNLHSNSCLEEGFKFTSIRDEKAKKNTNDRSLHIITPFAVEKVVPKYPNIEINRNLMGAMDFQPNFQTTPQAGDNMLRELMGLNKKNQSMITKFNKTCIKKRKKLSHVSSITDLPDRQIQKSHKRSNTIEQEVVKTKKKINLLPMIGKKNKL